MTKTEVGRKRTPGRPDHRPAEAGRAGVFEPARTPSGGGRRAQGTRGADARHGARLLGRFEVPGGSRAAGGSWAPSADGPADERVREAFGPLRAPGGALGGRGRVSVARAAPPDLSVMILPQVHLRKPCYDFYFL